MKTTLATILVIGTLLLGCTTGTTPSVVTSATTYTPADPTKGAIAFNLPLIGSGTKSIKTDAQALVQGYDIYVYSSTDDEPVVNTTTGGEVYVDYLVADTYIQRRSCSLYILRQRTNNQIRSWIWKGFRCCIRRQYRPGKHNTISDAFKLERRYSRYYYGVQT